MLPVTARITYNNQTRVPDLLWILRFNTRYIRASPVYRTIQKGHTYYSTSKHRDLINITRPQMKINIVKKQYRVTNVYFTFSQPSQPKKKEFRQQRVKKNLRYFCLKTRRCSHSLASADYALWRLAPLLQRTPFRQEQMYQGCKDTSLQFLRLVHSIAHSPSTTVRDLGVLPALVLQNTFWLPVLHCWLRFFVMLIT